MPVVRVNRKAADRIDAGHLWIFASDMVDRGTAQTGDVVRVMSGTTVRWGLRITVPVPR